MKSSPHVTVFEAAIIADYDAQSAVERELGFGWRAYCGWLRRATTMETGLFEIQAHHLSRFRQIRALNSREVFDAMFSRYETALWRHLGQILFARCPESAQTAGKTAVSVSAAGKNCRPTNATSADFRARRSHHC
jgi:hypothetical protein